MGVDLVITLPPHAAADEVADLMGIFLGKAAKLVPLSGGGDAVSCRVEGVSVTALGRGLEGSLDIRVDGFGRVAMYQLDSSSFGERYLIFRAGSEGVEALALALVDWFGGRVDYNDCDGIDADHVARYPKWPFVPHDGEQWDRYQRDKAALKPIPEAIRDFGGGKG